MRRDIARVGFVLTLCLFFTAPAWGQTRAEKIAQQQADKARTAEPYTPNRVEKFFEKFEGWFSGAPRGWYPAFGTVYPTGGFTFGGGYRHYIGYDSFVDAGALYSIRGYKKVQITRQHTQSPGRAGVPGRLGRLVGRDRDPLLRARYRLRSGRRDELPLEPGLHGGRRRAAPGRLAQASLGRRGWTTTRRRPAWVPPRQSRRGSRRRQRRCSANRGCTCAASSPPPSTGWDSPGYSRRGGLYRVAYEVFNPLGREDDTFGFVRTEIVQHIPILRETWVVSLRARA